MFDQDEMRLLEALAKARLAASSFPGFDFASVPAAVVNPGTRTTLVSHPAPPAGFSRVSGDVWVGPPLALSGATAALVGGQWCAVMPAFYARPADGTDLQMTWLHEGFHAFQRSRGWPLTSPDDPWVVIPPLAVALARAEMEALGTGLGPDMADQDEARAQARLFLGARTARRAQVSNATDLSSLECAVETHEGVANWVMGQIDSQTREGRWAALMRTVLDRPAGPVFSLFRGPWYASGAAICCLLEVLDPAWPEQLPDHPLEDILRDAVGDTEPVAVPAPRSWVEEATLRHEAWEAYRQGQIKRLRAGRPVKLGAIKRLDVDPMNSERLDAAITVHTRMLRVRGEEVEVYFDHAVPGCPVEAVMVDASLPEAYILPPGASEGPGFSVRPLGAPSPRPPNVLPGGTTGG